jgi:archaemetzincin
MIETNTRLKPVLIKFLFIPLFFLLGLFIYCQPNNVKTATIVSQKSEGLKTKAILIQPFIGFNYDRTQIVLSGLKEVFNNTITARPINLPISAYVKARNRYRADSLLDFLMTLRGEDTISVGLTNCDISATKGNIPDWGVMGLSYMPGRACVVSSFRLHKENLNDQLMKVVLHELGHALGLPHCKAPGCIMKDAEGKNNIDQETGFCEFCKKVLRQNGFTIK